MQQKKIVITGGPGTGKTTVINELIDRGYSCKTEISRQVTLAAREEGIEQLFLTDPLLFSEKLLEGRAAQYLEADKTEDSLVFFDRGLPDVHAYMNFTNTEYPPLYETTCKAHPYTKVFIMPPWKEIYTCDNERYEDYKTSVALYKYLKKGYEELGYHLIEVPTGTVEFRTDFILKSL
ncbi:ATP-binding protein [Urechidicola sp. KH5]